MKNNRKQNNADYGRFGIIAAITAAVIFIVVIAVSCGTKNENPGIEVLENGANIGVNTEAASTETHTAATTESPTTEPLETEGATTEEQTANHDLPDTSGLMYPFNTVSFDWDEATLDGWRHYNIPTEYEETGGYLPDVVQVYTYGLCKEKGLDYSMVLALIEVESGYKYDAVSVSGAVGYMQIVSRYHSEYSEEALLNPYLNIETGIDYLSELSERFSSQEEVLTAYHYGTVGAYALYWNKGRMGSPYSDTVLEVAERIQEELFGA
ncbi:MAG: lytic transglycosylase domain-containing protein [Lachnospiraceae bacterium]|nr:lytic transglycosylase domain-containing protein [Lachnospiraceae bacterium]